MPAGISAPRRGGLAAGPRWRPPRAGAARVFLICQVVYTVFWTPYILREHFPALTLAEEGTLNVKRYAGWTDDIFAHGEGRAFINNNPGASLTGAIPLILLRPAFRGIENWNRALPPIPRREGDGEIFWRAAKENRVFYFLAVAFATVALVMAPATAGVMAYLCRSLTRAGLRADSAAAVAVLCGIGTPLVFRAGSLNHNLLVADAGFAALLALWNAGAGGISARRALVAGLFAGYAILCDYSGVVVLLAVAVYAAMRAKRGRERWLAMAWASAGAIPGVAALLVYQWWAFGAFLAPSQQYMPAITQTAHGYRGFGWPSASLAVALLFDPKFGLFAYCPLLAPGLAAPFIRRARSWFRWGEIPLLIGYFAAFLVFCSANQYSWLQPLTGFRYLVPVVPGLAVLAIAVAGTLARPFRIALGVVAIAQSLLIAGAHVNDIRLAPAALAGRGFTFLWMTRLNEAGTPQLWVRVLGFVALASLGWALFHTMRLLFATPAGGESKS